MTDDEKSAALSGVAVDRIVMPLPCPFCGSKDVSVDEGSTFRWRVAVCNCCGAQSGDVRVQTAGSGTPEEWEKRAVEAALAEWNKRHNAELCGGPSGPSEQATG